MSALDPFWIVVALLALAALMTITRTGYFVEIDWGVGKRLRIGPQRKRQKVSDATPPPNLLNR